MKNILKKIFGSTESENSNQPTATEKYDAELQDLFRRIDKQKAYYERMNERLQEIRNEEFAHMTSFPVLVESFVEGEF